MKRIATLVLLLTVACSTHQTMNEGDARIRLTGPRMARVGQQFLLKGTFEGDVASLPFGEYVGIEVYANDLQLMRSVSVLDSRFLSFVVSFSPETFRQLSGTYASGPLDFDEVDPLGVQPPIEGDSMSDDVTVKLRVVVSLLEINYKNELEALGPRWYQDHTMRVSCEDRSCFNVY